MKSETVCLIVDNKKKKLSRKKFFKIMQKNYAKQCSMIKTIGSCKVCKIDKNKSKNILKSSKKLKKYMKKCFECEKIDIGKIKNFNIMDPKLKCKDCKKTRKLLLKFAEEAKETIGKKKMEECNKCIKKNKKKCSPRNLFLFAKKTKKLC